ncbi:hypothetical protein Bbelb_142310 [Branchiostoma belcheri]|nr:hypothetical protein Bbelb_142310 [Branchiostoma belcheri]
MYSLILSNNDISQVDAFVDFPPILKNLFLDSNRITTIPESFLSELKPPRRDFFLRLWQNPFLCDCKIQWITRLRRCVWEHRQEGCVDAPLASVRRCMLANCNFHPSGVVIILDRFKISNLYKDTVHALTPDQLLKCDPSPHDLEGQLLRDLTMSTCRASPDASADPRLALPAAPSSVRTCTEQSATTASMETGPTSQHGGRDATTKHTAVTSPTTSSEGTEQPVTGAAVTTEVPTTIKADTAMTNSSETPTVLKEPIAVILGAIGVFLVILFAVGIIRCISYCRKRRQALTNNMVAAVTLQTMTAARLPTIISVGQSGNFEQEVSPRDSKHHVYEEIKDEDIGTSGRATEAPNV